MVIRCVIDRKKKQRKKRELELRLNRSHSWSPRKTTKVSRLTSKGGRVIIPSVSQEEQLDSNVSILLSSATCLIFCISIFGFDKPEFTSVGV